MARSKNAKGRGNFAFALLAMAFLEFTCRLCKSDPTGVALPDFSHQLNLIESRYFNKIAGLNAPVRAFSFPYIGTQTNDFLICALFDLIRNGLAHQYQQILVHLQPDNWWGITLSGPAKGKTIAHITNYPRSRMTHLTLRTGTDGVTWLVISPARLFLDFKKAFDDARLIERPLTVEHFDRPPAAGSNVRYNFSPADVDPSF